MSKTLTGSHIDLSSDYSLSVLIALFVSLIPSGWLADLPLHGDGDGND